MEAAVLIFPMHLPGTAAAANMWRAGGSASQHCTERGRDECLLPATYRDRGEIVEAASRCNVFAPVHRHRGVLERCDRMPRGHLWALSWLAMAGRWRLSHRRAGRRATYGVCSDIANCGASQCIDTELWLPSNLTMPPESHGGFDRHSQAPITWYICEEGRSSHSSYIS